MHFVGERGGEQAHCVQRLAQIVTCGSEKLRLGPIGLFRRDTRLFEIDVLHREPVGQHLLLETVAQRFDQHAVVVARE